VVRDAMEFLEEFLPQGHIPEDNCVKYISLIITRSQFLARFSVMICCCVMILYSLVGAFYFYSMHPVVYLCRLILY
jgi:hypothetical protein